MGAAPTTAQVWGPWGPARVANLSLRRLPDPFLNFMMVFGSRSCGAWVRAGSERRARGLGLRGPLSHLLRGPLATCKQVVCLSACMRACVCVRAVHMSGCDDSAARAVCGLTGCVPLAPPPLNRPTHPLASHPEGARLSSTACVYVCVYVCAFVRFIDEWRRRWWRGSGGKWPPQPYLRPPPLRRPHGRGDMSRWCCLPATPL